MPIKPSLRFLPAIEKLLQHERLQALSSALSSEILTQCARRAVAVLRERWMKRAPESINEERVLEEAVALTLEETKKLLAPSLKKVINATGVILHTGLGRAVISTATQQTLQETLDGYCNLELDLATGKRGDRHRHVDRKSVV